MASIDRRPNGKWRARWRETPGGPQKAQHFERKADAERHLAEVSAGLLRGTYVDPRAGRIAFKAYAEKWRGLQVHRASTAAQVSTNLQRHVYPVLGTKDLSTIRRSDVQALAKRLEAKGLSPRTVETVYRYVVAIFRSAVADRLIAQSPCVEIKLPKVEPKRVKPMEVAVVERLTEALPERYRALVVLAAGTGMRQGECFGLTVDRVDFLRRQVTVDRQIDPAGSGGFGPPKTTASYRTIPLPAIVVDALAAHLASFPAGPNGLIFTDADGRPLRRNRFGELWRRSRTKAKVGDEGFHSLRHFYASLLIRHGESVKVVQARLGHASASETLDTYSHLWPDSEDRTREAVDLVLGARTAEDSVRTADAGQAV
jgi:integrase